MIHTIELLQHPPIPDAWHNITAPGGYEWWYFDAEEPRRSAARRDAVRRLRVSSALPAPVFALRATPGALRRRAARNSPPRISRCITAERSSVSSSRTSRRRVRVRGENDML